MQLKIRKYGTNGQNFLILHGLLGSSQNWHSVAQRLAEHLRVLVPDLRNHGESPHDEHSILLMSEDVANLLGQEKLDKIFLMGHSMGGLAAMRFAFEHPTKLHGLIVVDIAPKPQLSRMNWIFEALESIDLSKVRKKTDAEQKLSEKINHPQIRRFLLQNLKRQENGSYKWQCNLPELHRFVRDGHRFQANKNDVYEGPTLFIGGEDSDHKLAEHEESIARHFPKYRLEIVKHAGHWVHSDAMDEFVDLVNSFIQKLN